MELDRETRTALNISATEAEILSYTYTGSAPIEVVSRVDLGATGGLIAGSGNYYCRIYINGTFVLPDMPIAVPTGVTKATVISRTIPLEANDVVSIKVLGLPADTSIKTTATLRNVTPALVSDINGPGTVVINHNYGGTDVLAYKDGAGLGIDGAEVRVYLRTDYDAGNVDNAHVLAKTYTDVNGRWIRSLMLDPGNYSLVYSLQQYYGPDVIHITVSAS